MIGEGEDTISPDPGADQGLLEEKETMEEGEGEICNILIKIAQPKGLVLEIEMGENS
jgi:hypothetical protein